MARTSDTLFCRRIVKRREAVKENLTYYYTGKLCANGHDSLRITSVGCCQVCAKDRKQRWLKTNRETVNEKQRSKTKSASEKFSVFSRTQLRKYLGWLDSSGFIESKQDAYINNHPYYRDGSICWNDHYSVFSTRDTKARCLHCRRKEPRNPSVKPRTDHQREKTRENVKKWASENPLKYKILRDKQNIFRHKRLRDATPIWLSAKHKEDLLKIYRERDALKEKTGESFHVDHVVPIKNKIVCGLHVPWNLRVVSKKENKEKANKFVGEFY